MTQRIRGAAPADAAEITAMIHELADFEGAAELCTVTEAQIRAALFGEPATVRGQIADVDDQVVAMALWFPNFSTWDGVAGVFLEDLYVRPAYRRRGLARARCWRPWRVNASTAATPGCLGRCSTGTPAQSLCTRRSADSRNAAGSPTGSLGRSWLSWPNRADRRRPSAPRLD